MSKVLFEETETITAAELKGILPQGPADPSRFVYATCSVRATPRDHTVLYIMGYTPADGGKFTGMSVDSTGLKCPVALEENRLGPLQVTPTQRRQRFKDIHFQQLPVGIADALEASDAARAAFGS